MIELSSIYIRLNNEPNDKALGYADIVFNDLFALHDIKIKENIKGELRIYFPNNVKRKAIAHPISDDLRKHIEINILNKYEYIRSRYGRESIQSNNQ